MSKSMETIMASSNPFVDIFHLDVVWVGDYADYLLTLNDQINRTILLAHNEQNIEAGMSMGRLVAVPQAADFGVMFTRMDILSKHGFSRPPQTWTEMESMLAAIVATERKSNPSFIGYIGQLSQYEGMTCNVLEWLKSESAGSILEPNRTLSLLDSHLPNGQRAQAIATRWRKWVQNGWVAVGHDEMSALREWTRGNVLFHRNWPFVGAQTRAARVSWPWVVTKLPGAEPGMSGAALGGWMWGVSKATRNPEAAVSVLEWLMSVQFQKIRTMTYGSLPTVKALYDDPDVCTMIGDCNLFRDMQIAHRPSGAAGKEYQNVSISIYDSWYSILAGARSASKGLAHMNQEIANALGIDILGPPTNVQHTHAVAIVFVALSAGEFACILCAAAASLWLRRQPSVQRAGLTYINIVLGGMTVLLVYSLLHIGIPTAPVCLARSLLMPVATVTLFGVLGLRNGQLYRLSGNLYAPPKWLPAGTIIRYILPLAALLAFLWTVLAIQSPLAPTDVRLTSWRYVGCSSANPDLHNLIRSISHGTIISVFLLAAWISHQARNVGTGFSESRAIGVSLANAFLITCAVMPVIDLDVTDQPMQFALRSTAIILSTSLFLVVDVFPRLFRAFRESKTGHATMDAHSGYGSTALKSVVACLPALQSFVNGFSLRRNSAATSPHLRAAVDSCANAIPPVKSMAAAGLDNHLQRPSNSSHSQQLRRVLKRPAEMDDGNPGIAVDVGFAREAVVSVRSSTRVWLLKAAPWTVARLYLFPREGLLVYHHVVIGGSLKGKVFPLSLLLSVEVGAKMGTMKAASGSSEKCEPSNSSAMFSLAFPDIFLNVMTANPDECIKWVGKLNGIAHKATSRAR